MNVGNQKNQNMQLFTFERQMAMDLGRETLWVDHRLIRCEALRQQCGTADAAGRDGGGHPRSELKVHFVSDPGSQQIQCIEAPHYSFRCQITGKAPVT